MKLAYLAWHHPEPEGTPTGRCLYALCEGLVREGHDLQVRSWARHPPQGPLPEWCEWHPLPAEASWRMHGRAVVRPRHDLVRAPWRIGDDTVGVADEPVSWPAFRGAAHSAVQFHYLTRIDARALDRRSAHDLQDRRHERFVARRAPAVLTYSSRVASIARRRAHVVPIAYPVPEEPLPVVDEPIALLLANWGWPPNAAALQRMLGAWPVVRRHVPDARLVIAGWGSLGLGIDERDGVEVIGEVDRASDALAKAAVLAFPCPPTSGPKVKVLEALAHGVPVVTTPAGAEGLCLGDGEGAVVVDGPGYAEALAAVLADDRRRHELGVTGRAAVMAHHAPVPAARAKVAALSRALGVG